MQHCMRSISKCILKNKETQEKLVDMPWIKMLTGHAEEFDNGKFCPRVSKLDLFLALVVIDSFLHSLDENVLIVGKK